MNKKHFIFLMLIVCSTIFVFADNIEISTCNVVSEDVLTNETINFRANTNGTIDFCVLDLRLNDEFFNLYGYTIEEDIFKLNYDEYLGNGTLDWESITCFNNETNTTKDDVNITVTITRHESTLLETPPTTGGSGGGSSGSSSVTSQMKDDLERIEIDSTELFGIGVIIFISIILYIFIFEMIIMRINKK